MTVKETEYYDFLNITPNASDDEIKKAYLKVAAKVHPDKCQDRTPEGLQKATEKFQYLNKIKDILSDKNKRAIYDREGKEGLERSQNEGGGSEAHFDMFKNMFNGGGFPFNMGNFHEQMTREKPKPPASKHKLHCSLADLYNGKEFEIKLKQQIICVLCQGKGTSNPDAIKRCVTCNGKGQVAHLRQVGPGMMQQIIKQCDTCGGKGKNIPDKKDICKGCNGDRITREDRIHKINVKSGMTFGSVLHFANMGEEHPDTDKKGDLDFILIEDLGYNPSQLKRNVNDLHVDIDISLIEALCGVSLTINQLDKRKLSVTYNNKVIQPGEVMKIKGEGMPILNNFSIKGDLYIHFTVNLPKVLDNNRKDILQKVLGQKKPITEKDEKDEKDTKDDKSKGNVTICNLEEIKNYKQIFYNQSDHKTQFDNVEAFNMGNTGNMGNIDNMEDILQEEMSNMGNMGSNGVQCSQQ
jgi:DnaJ family protein A protein 2